MTSPEQLGELYLSVYHRMRRAVEEGMNVSGLTLARTKVLAQLQHGPARPGVLAGECGVAPRTITDAVDGLEREGLVVRQADPADRRATLVAVTSQGQAALAVASVRREELLRLIFGALDADDRATMARLLGDLDHAVAALISDAAPGLTTARG